MSHQVVQAQRFSYLNIVLTLAVSCAAGCAKPAPAQRQNAYIANGGNPAIANNGGAGTGAAPDSIGRASTGGTPLPCDVDQVVRRNCQSCHAAQPLSGVPMALVTWEDFQRSAVSNPGASVHAMADLRVHNTAMPMPPAPGVLPPQDKSVLEAWLSAGAPAGTDPSCAPKPVTVDAGTETMVAVPPDQGDCYKLLAHGKAVAGDTSPYPVNNQHYVEFYFDAPWPAGSQGISFKTVFDEHPEIVHHWLLYLDENGNSADGTILGSDGAHFTAPTLIAGWAPGSNNSSMLPNDVGMEINGKSRKLILEIHYFANASFMSRSGIEVCTTKTPRPNVATVSWLGTEGISLLPGATGNASGNCSAAFTQPIHILRTWPHMHLLGIHMKTVINRKAGGLDMLVDQDFNFNSQLAYDKDLILQPGDTLSTTCTYQNTTSRQVGFGPATTDEMCYNFVTAYPANLLKNGFTLNGASNTCLQ